MFAFSTKRLAVALSLALASIAVSGGLAQALLDHGANFAVTVPATAVVPVGICSAQSVGTSNNVNRGEVERSDARTRADSESRCDVANDILRNLHNVLNENNNRNIVGNLSHNANHANHHLENDNIRDIGNQGALISL